MPHLRYDEQDLIRSLNTLAPRLKTVFAASCAQRLLPAYGSFTAKSERGDPPRVAAILERLWSALTGKAMSPEEITVHLETCMSLIPAEDDEPWFEEQAYAEDAGAALAYALRTLAGGKSEDAAWAARRSYEAVDHYLTHHLGLDSSGPGGEEQLMRHPLMQAELSRQRRDLGELQQTPDAADPAIVERFRARAVAEGSGFFQVMT